MNLMSYKKKIPDCICWDCKNAFGNCSWSDHFELEDGCTVLITPRKKENGQKGFWVLSCPKFEKEER